MRPLVPLARLPLVRALKTSRGLVPTIAWIPVAMIGARVIARAAASDGGTVVDGVTLGWLGPIVIPFVAYTVTGAALARRNLRDAAAPLVSFGASREDAALAHVVTVAALASLVSALATIGSLVAVRGALSDIGTSGGIAALAGATYGALFVCAARYGKRGGGRSVFLVLDALFGERHGVLSVLFPRAHVRNLLGGIAPANLGPRASTALLVLLASAALVWTFLRARKKPRVYVP